MIKLNTTEWYDWEDLLGVFGKTTEDFQWDDNDPDKQDRHSATFLRNHIDRICLQLVSSDEPLSEQDTTFIAASRQLVKNVGEGIHEGKTLFAGMAQIKHDYTFLTYLHVLLECVWD